MINKLREILVNPDKCLKDGLCIKVCPAGILKNSDSGIPQIKENLAPNCTNCGHCVSICPSSAISVNGYNGDKLADTKELNISYEELENLVKSRRSIRNFQDKAISLDELNKLLEITRYAPTAKNMQVLKWYFLDSKEKVMRLGKAVIEAFRPNKQLAPLVKAFDKGRDIIHRGASSVIVSTVPVGHPWGKFDSYIALANLDMAAATLGIGTCWAGFTSLGASLSDEVRKSIKIPDGQEIAGVMMLGYPIYSYKKIPIRKEINLTVVS